MRKSFFVALAVLVAAGVLAAQTHDNKTEKPVKADIVLAANTRVGSTILQAGEYRVVCDTKEVTFLRQRDNKKVLTVPCEGKHLDKPADETVAYTTADPSGVAVLNKLLLRGSNVEHVFPAK
jgi:hypothetical protein